jgi:GTPase SAR1 family protein
MELTDIEILCYNNRNMNSIEQYLTKLVTQFEINKGQFSLDTRLLLRQRFIDLAEQCQKRNASKQVISLTMKLADHAYKLPERM